MPLVIFNKQTTQYLEGEKLYKSKAAATRALNKAVKEKGIMREDFDIAEYGEFKDTIEKMVTRKNLLTGKEFQEPVNTPIYMSPAFEAYFSM